MRPLERKRCFFVLIKAEGASGKTLYRVAGITIRCGAIFYELTIVKIGMAGGAGVVVERIDHAAGMAFPAINLLVFSGQREVRPVVVEIIPGIPSPESLLGVAFGAIHAESAVMDILMTSSAICSSDPQAVLENCTGIAIPVVTYPAIQVLVASFQREMRRGVVEPVLAGKCLPAQFGMAGLAVGAEVVVVRIGMAAGTIGKRYIGKLLERPAVAGFFAVAIGTFHLAVLPEKRKIRFTVIKARRNSKRARVVAIGAVLGKRVLVDVGMTAYTFLAQTQVGFFVRFVFRILNIIRLVAFPAVCRAVCSC